MRYCAKCGLDFWKEATGSNQLPPEAQAAPPAIVANAASQRTEVVPILVGIAWLIGAAAIAYLAFLQLQYSSFGFADSSEALGLALWNGLSAAITAYFGAMAMISPSAGRMRGGVIWAVINVAYGAYQVSQGLTHEVFLLALVAFGIAGVLAFVSWSQFRSRAMA